MFWAQMVLVSDQEWRSIIAGMVHKCKCQGPKKGQEKNECTQCHNKEALHNTKRLYLVHKWVHW